MLIKKKDNGLLFLAGVQEGYTARAILTWFSDHARETSLHEGHPFLSIMQEQQAQAIMKKRPSASLVS